MTCEPLLSINNISKEFPGVKALTDVSFDVYPGEIHVLIGENGAGKSTLIKMLSGVYSIEKGSIKYKGKEINFRSPKDAIQNGIAVIHQELSIVPDLTVAENIFLGRENKKGVVIDTARTDAIAREYISEIGVDIKPNALLSSLSNAEKQMVEIARAIFFNVSLIIMDEPTSALSDSEVSTLFRIIRNLKRKNVSVIYISHRIKELFEIGDRVTVLRDGRLVKTADIKDVDTNSLVSMMVGREIKNYFIRSEHTIGHEILKVDNLSKEGMFKDISFEIKQGQITGISGLVGSGRTELIMTLFGAIKADRGSIFYKGKKVTFSSPCEAIKAGIGFLPEERRTEGLIVDDDVKKNISLPSLVSTSKHGLIDYRWETKNATKYVEKLMIKTPSIHSIVKNLSGGNQQKIVIAKWLAANSQVLFLDEPTRGIDVNAKTEIYRLINDFVVNGGTVLVVSSEMPELLGICDRILVMREGCIVGDLDISEASEERIMGLASIQA